MSHLRWFFNVATVQARCSAATVLVVCVNSLVDAETNRRLFAVTSNPLARDAIQILTCQPGTTHYRL